MDPKAETSVSDSNSSTNCKSRSREDSILQPSTMSQSEFRAWQERFHEQTLGVQQQQRVIVDSQRQFHDSQQQLGGLMGGGSATCYAQDQSGQATDEEFQRLMQNPASFLGLLQGGSPSGHQQQFYSCPAPSGNTVLDNTNERPIQPPNVHIAKKKRAVKAIAPNSKKAKKPVVLSDDDIEGDEGNPSTRWSDTEVHQLIAFRQEMDEEFERTAKKQGQNTWEKLQGLMVTAIENFSKIAEACRKKWKVIYKSYNYDKRLLLTSGEGRKISCKFFDEIDQGFNNRANVRKLSHGDARGSANPCPLDPEVPQDLPDSGEQTAPGTPPRGSVPNDTSPPSGKALKKTTGEIVSAAIVELVSHTATIASEIQNTSGILKGLQSQLDRMIDKL